MKEEIETQRRVTRQAQRQFHTLQQTLAQKHKEIELIQRHLATFAARTMAMMTSPAAAGAPPPTSFPSSHSSTLPVSPTHTSSALAVLVAGAQTGGIGARHRESIAAAASLSESQQGTTVGVVSTAAKLKDQAQRQDLYKKKLKQLLDRLCRHLQFIEANLEALQIKHESARRELSFFHAKVVQARNQCTELEHKTHELVDEQSTHAHNAMLVLDSLREEIASRSMMSRHRYEADRRREELLALVQSSPVTRSSSRTSSTDRSNGAFSRSSSRKNSIHVLTADKAQHDFASTVFSGDVGGRHSPSPTARHRSNSIDMQQFVHRETFMQIYEGQYARVLEETGESDLSVAIERFVNFKETKRHLLQIETDVSAQNQQLEREREAHNDLVRKLRVSGIAEVEKRKKIRDFLEQMHHVKAQVKSQAKDKFLDQLKTFSCTSLRYMAGWTTLYARAIGLIHVRLCLRVRSVDVQQGIANIVELFKCLDDRAAPSTAVLPSPLLPASPPATVAQALAAIVHYCVQVTRTNPAGAPIVFTDDQVERLRAFVSSDDVRPHRDGALPSTRLATAHGDVSEQSTSRSGGTSAAATLSSAVALTSSLLQAKRRQSSTESALGWESTLKQPRSGDTTSATLVDETDEHESDDVSSESDTEDVRCDIKRSERETLQQVEALLKTFDARQSMLNQEARQAATTGSPTLKHRRSAGRHGSLHLVPVLEGGAPLELPSSLLAAPEATSTVDKAARLEAVHAFFREKRRRERQEQQHQREMLALLAEAAYNTSSRALDSSNARSRQPGSQGAGSTASSAGSKANGPGRPKLASMVVRKRSNGVVSLALHAAVQQTQQQQQQQQLQQANSASAAPRKSLRPKTVR